MAVDDRGPVIYGLEFQSRGLTARVGETERIHFLCGTQTLRSENQVHLVEYDEETDVLNKMVFPHPVGEIWDIGCSSADKDLIYTCHGSIQEGQYLRSASILRLEGASPEESDTGMLKMVAPLSSSTSLLQAEWHPTGSSPLIATIDDKSTVQLWNISGAHPQVSSRVQVVGRGRVNHAALCWNCHHSCSQLLAACDSSLHCWDTRTAKSNVFLELAHGPCIRGVDCNPNRPYHLTTCGDDCTVKFWDTRKLDSTLLTGHHHSHWVWSVKYNIFHDQLVLSGSSDSQVVLLRAASVASEPLRHLEEGESRQPLADDVLAKYEEHEDSVYAVTWSAADAWVFASLSYDGRLVINHVPSREKLSILTY